MPLTTCNASAPLPQGTRVTSPYGWRNLPTGRDLHTGVDLAADEGTPVFAVLPGRVVDTYESGELSGYGNTVVLEHAPDLYSLYAHLSRVLVSAEHQVRAGHAIGAVGRTAGTPEHPDRQFRQSGAHLHFELLSRWPPSGVDEDRIEPGPVFAELGIIIPRSGPVQLAADATACQPDMPPDSPPSAAESKSPIGGVLSLLSLVSLLQSISGR